MPRTKEAFNAMRSTTKKKIEMTALELFARNGLSVTVEQIAVTAGLSKGLLYNHYPSKESLITELVRQATEISAMGITAVVRNDNPPVDKIKEISAMMCEMLCNVHEGVNYFMFMLQVGMSGFQIPADASYSDKLTNPLESLAQIVALGQLDGSTVDGDVMLLSVTYWAAIQGLCCYSIMGMPMVCDAKSLNRILIREEFI